MVFIRAVLVWFVLLIVAVVNGGVREAWLISRMGGSADKSRQVVPE